MRPPADVERFTAGLTRNERPGVDEVRRLVEGVLAGTVDLDAFGRWLVALAEAGETAAEIAGVAAALRGRMVPIDRGRLPAGTTVADTCGTGGDASGSFNISTAAAIVVAAAGQPVAKHGNRAVSSRTGSADVLAELGVRIDAPPEVAASCLAEEGLCFCLAPAHHPAMARVGPLRKSLGRPTVFNLVGPLCNPAGAEVQVIGVGRSLAREPLAEAARLLADEARTQSPPPASPGDPPSRDPRSISGTEAADGSLRGRHEGHRTLVVSGFFASADGTLDPKPFDEVSLFGPTDVIDVTANGVTRHRWTPESFGLTMLPADRLRDLVVDGPEASAAAIRAVLAGEAGPRRDVVVLNAAAVLYAAGRAGGQKAARELAERAIDSGAAAALLFRFAARSRGSTG
jgi:anthranilate phosphoribosyltransferase